MEASKETQGTLFVLWFAAVAGLLLLFNMVAIPLAWGGINAEGGIRGAVQLVILLGFVLVLLFDVVSLGWAMRRGKAGSGEGGLVALGILAVVGMMGAKVMVDEIARETPLGRAGGEWGILYACLILQLSYVIVVLSRVKTGRR